MNYLASKIYDELTHTLHPFQQHRQELITQNGFRCTQTQRMHASVGEYMEIFVLVLRKGGNMKGSLARDTYTKYNWYLHSPAFWGKGGLKLITGKFDNRCVSWQIYIKRSRGNYPLKRVVFLCALGTVQSLQPLCFYLTWSWSLGVILQLLL